jgi:hypothetical protein
MSFSVTTGYTFILLVFQFAKGLLDSPQFATVVGTGYLVSSAAERGTDSHLMYLVFASAAFTWSEERANSVRRKISALEATKLRDTP